MQSQMAFQILPFDTKLFEFKVAKIKVSQSNLSQLTKILGELGENRVKLAYWRVDCDDKVSADAARAAKGILGCVQVTYFADHKDIILPPDLKMAEEYQELRPSADLKLLAFQAGNYSHFRNDEHFPAELYFRLYKQWVINSVNHKIADKVFVVRHSDEIVGMITAGIRGQRGDIGLLAVKEEFRGHKIGETLVRTAQAYFINKKLAFSQVVTQEANEPACHLYSKCGYCIEKKENFYHFWL